MDNLTRLQTERRALASRLQEIDALLDDYKLWEARVASVIDNASAIAVESKPARTPRKGHNQGSPMQDFMEAVANILSMSDRPMDRSSLLQALVAANIDVGGEDPKNTLSARLSRMDNVVNVKGLGYWPKDRPLPKDDIASDDDILSLV